MIKKRLFFFYCLLSSSFFSLEASSQETYLIQNMENVATLPRNFRTTGDPVEGEAELPSTEGLSQLNVSGSAQFSQNSLKKIMETVPGENIIVIDLREEPHGVLNGRAITWYSENNWINNGLSREEISVDELLRIEEIQNSPQILIFDDKKQSGYFFVDVKHVQTEQEMVEELGLGYFRIIAKDHDRPSDEAVDDFIAFIKTLEEGTWLHFHCSAGRGRTTTFMTLYDIMKNGSQVSLEEIVERQKLLGGMDLFGEPEEELERPRAKAREELIREFYQYAKAVPDFSKSWSDWKSKITELKLEANIRQ